MPWKETSPMEQRLEFVLRWSKHETSMAELCRTFEISRQTGYELVAAFQAAGLDGLKPHSRAPHHHPNAIAEEVCGAVLRAKEAHPSWVRRSSSHCATNPNRSSSSGRWPAPVARSWPALG